MKHLLLTTIAAVLLVGCGESQKARQWSEADHALFKAVYEESIQATEEAIANGANVNAQNKIGMTPLHGAYTKEIAELLIAKGADVNAKSDDGKTPLDMTNGREAVTETADLLRKHGGKTGFPQQSFSDVNRSLKYVDLPVDNYDPNKSWGLSEEEKASEEAAQIAQAKQTTAKASDISLFDAAAEGNIEAVKKHLAAGTALQHENNVGWTSPLHQAAGRGHKEIVELLIAAGADVNTKGYKGSTPLDDAIGTPRRVLHPETADLLRKHGGKTGEELKAEGK